MGYQMFSVNSEKNAPMGEYMSHDGTVKINLDEIWDQVEHDCFSHREDVLMHTVIDIIVHEDNHKAFAEAQSDNTTESFNEQDERIFRLISDWIEFEKMTSVIQYDWK